MLDSDVKKTYLELSDPASGSHKFYEIAVEGPKITIRFGRIGTAGHVRIENHPSDEAALQAAEKKIEEKLSKGYEVAVIGGREKQPLKKRKRPSLDEQIESLAACGISLSPGLSKEDLLSEYEAEEFIDEPYLLLLVALGGETEEENSRPISTNIRTFDTECIEDHGDYARIATRLRDLTGGDLPLQDIRDYVDVEKEQAWIAFSLDGQEYKWEFEVESDWVDTQIFSLFDSLLRSRPTNKRFTYLNLDGQDCLIGCATPEQFERLKATSGLDFKWMTA